MVAGKAGMNNDPHHGHLDIGHFVVHWQKEYFIRDLGSRGYDEKYFDDMRWDYPQASSIGHNVIFVNGEKQIPGKMRKQPWNYEVGGDVEEFRTSDKQDYVRMNPTKAYPDKELKRWKRNIILEKPEITLVLDEIDAEPGSKIEVRFHPGVDFEVQDDIAMLKGKNGTMALIPLSKEALKIQPGRHACQYVNATSRFFWEDYFDTEITSKDNKTIIATLIILFVVKMKTTAWKRTAIAVGGLFAFIGFTAVVFGVYYHTSTVFSNTFKYYALSAFSISENDPFTATNNYQSVIMTRGLQNDNGEVKIASHPNPYAPTPTILFVPGKF